MNTHSIKRHRLYRHLTAALSDYDNPASLGNWFRRRRARHIVTLISQCFNRYQCVNILDIGGRENYWNIIPEDYFSKFRLSITLVNNDDELDVGSRFKTNKSVFSHVTANGCDLSQFENNSFHMVHCNSVIEHVGSWGNMQAMAREIQRLAPSYYVQTPNFWFPLEPHFVTLFYHWLPEAVRARLLLKVSLGHMNQQSCISDAVEVVQSVNLIDRMMLQALFPEARIEAERFLFLNKSITAIKSFDQDK